MAQSAKKASLSGRVRVFAGRLYNHDYLWFSSTEISKMSATLPYLHNYALCYALAQYERAAAYGSSPAYDEDLAVISQRLYATPAAADQVERTVVTFNAIDTLTLRTDVKPSVNTPDLGKRAYLNPVFETCSLNKPQRGYALYLFTFDDEQPRSVFRLGKKGCPVRACWQQIEWAEAEWSDAPLRPTHPVNPLDVAGRIVRFAPVLLPPHLLMRIAEIEHDWFIRRGPHVIHVPRRVSQRIGLGQS